MTTEYRCLECKSPIQVEDEINTDYVICPNCNTEFDLIFEEDEDLSYWFFLQNKSNNRAI